MKIYSYYMSHGTSETGVRIEHSCGHPIRYDFGGSADYFQPLRAQFAMIWAPAPCPDCRTIAQARLLPEVPPIALPAGLTEVGPGVLTTEHPGAEGALLFVAEEPPVLLEKQFPTDGNFRWGVAYTYPTRLFGPPCCYLHQLDGVVYTAAQLRWVEEYSVRCHTDKGDGWFERWYHFGSSFQTTAQFDRIRAVLAARGEKLLLNSVQLSDGTVRGEE